MRLEPPEAFRWSTVEVAAQGAWVGWIERHEPEPITWMVVVEHACAGAVFRRTYHSLAEAEHALRWNLASLAEETRLHNKRRGSGGCTCDAMRELVATRGARGGAA